MQTEDAIRNANANTEEMTHITAENHTTNIATQGGHTVTRNTNNGNEGKCGKGYGQCWQCKGFGGSAPRGNVKRGSHSKGDGSPATRCPINTWPASAYTPMLNTTPDQIAKAMGTEIELANVTVKTLSLTIPTPMMKQTTIETNCEISCN